MGGFFNLPDPVSILEGAKTANLEREVINALVSAAYSAWISAMWSSGSAKWAAIIGEGQGMKDAATAIYRSGISKRKTFSLSRCRRICSTPTTSVDFKPSTTPNSESRGHKK